MEEKVYTLEETMKLTSDFIEEQARILETNLRERWRGSHDSLSIR